ncbi:hypothetical protein [Oceanobacillus kapialis]
MIGLLVWLMGVPAWSIRLLVGLMGVLRWLIGLLAWSIVRLV